MANLIKTVDVHLGDGYRVWIGNGFLDRCGSMITALTGPCRTAIITDSTVAPLYLGTVKDSLQRAGNSVCSYVYPAGESSKNLPTLTDILNFLASKHLTRTDCLVALGGGVCGDMAGFAAGCYLRGIRYVQLPTTLLAAIDSSVGGKTAVNLKAGKNLAGLFYQPIGVFCDPDSLKTLPQDIFLDGVAEVVKTGILSGESLFRRLETGISPAELPGIIMQCVTFKAGIAEQDERDTGQRRILNLGHTVGHAIEQCSGYTVLHGHAVSVGIAVMTRAAVKFGWCEPSCGERIITTLRRNHLPLSTPYSAKELSDAALADKKCSGGDITLIIPKRIGQCFCKKVPVQTLESIIAAGWEA